MPWVNKSDVCRIQYSILERSSSNFFRHAHMSGNSIRLGYRLLTTPYDFVFYIPYIAHPKGTTYSVCKISPEHNMRRCKTSVPKPAIPVKRLKIGAIQNHKCMQYTNNHSEVGSDMYRKKSTYFAYWH